MEEPRPAAASPRPRFSPSLWLIRILALLAIGLSAYLLWLALGDYVVPGCGVASDCDYVLGSRWSRVLDIPIAAAAIAVHAITLFASFAAGDSIAPRWRRLAIAIMLLTSSAAVGAAAWFFFVQLALLDSFCPYCMADHAIALLLWLAVLYVAFRHLLVARARHPQQHRRAISWVTATVMVLLGFVVAAGFAFVQFRYPGGAYQLAALDQPLDLPFDQVPVIGPPDAPHAIFLLGDYTCPHCRETHVWLAEAMKRYGRQITIVVLPVPINSKCNRAVIHDSPTQKYACEVNRLALAAWRAAPEKYAKVDALLFAPPKAMTPDEARPLIAKIVGEDALRAAEASSGPDQDLARDVNLFIEFHGGKVPKLLIGRTKIEGRPIAADQIFDTIEQQFHIRPVKK